jgi:hypothetical protein
VLRLLGIPADLCLGYACTLGLDGSLVESREWPADEGVGSESAFALPAELVALFPASARTVGYWLGKP